MLTESWRKWLDFQHLGCYAKNKQQVVSTWNLDTVVMRAVAAHSLVQYQVYNNEYSVHVLQAVGARARLSALKAE